jgi:septal ring factor EnvC (AmiA/AmiB activator)
MLNVPKAIDLESLKLLEARIDQFVEQHERVREEHEGLLQRLRDKEKQLAEATAQLKQYEQERAEMKTRLERILSRLGGLDLT